MPKLKTQNQKKRGQSIQQQLKNQQQARLPDINTGGIRSIEDTETDVGNENKSIENDASKVDVSWMDG